MANRRVAFSVPQLQLQDLGNGRDNLRRHPQAVGHVVPGYLAGYQSKDWGQRPRDSAGTGAGELQDGLGMVAQAPPGNGEAWTGASLRPR